MGKILRTIMATTRSALLTRMVPSTIVDNLVAKGHTLGSLQQLDNQKLLDLGLQQVHIDAIKDGTRPSVTDKVMHRVLSESRSTCCLCRKPGRPFVLHHIKPWGDGGTHDEDNLVLLCLEDHNEVHYSGGLSLRWDASKIKAAKANWKKMVKMLDQNQLARLKTEQHREVRWHWLHFDNLQDLSTRKGVRLQQGRLTALIQRLKTKQFLDEGDDITSPENWITGKHHQGYFLDFAQGREMAIYISDLAVEVADRLNILDISHMINTPNVLKAYVEEGHFVFIRAEFDISVDLRKGRDPSETDFRIAYAREANTTIEFGFDSYTALNSSSKGTHLLGLAKRSVIGKVTKLNDVNGKITLMLSPLGISDNFLLRHPSHGDWVKGQEPAEL